MACSEEPLFFSNRLSPINAVMGAVHNYTDSPVVCYADADMTLMSGVVGLGTLHPDPMVTMANGHKIEEISSCA
jgi:hypothetical protein